MRDRVFLDSNILIYAYSVDETEKLRIVNELLSRHNVILISTQTINEFVNVTTRKKMLTYKAAGAIVAELYDTFIVAPVDRDVVQKAIALADKHRYSYFDSLMVASALASDCSILYSEDMHNQHIIEASLKIINPFIK